MKLVWDLSDIEELDPGQVLIDLVFPDTLYYVEMDYLGNRFLRDINAENTLDRVPSLGLQVVTGFAFDYYAGGFVFDITTCSLNTVDEMMALATPKEQAIGAREVYFAYLVAEKDKSLRISPLMLRGEESIHTFCAKYGPYCKEIVIKNRSKNKILFVYRNGKLYHV